jgi:hypothetical protein
VYKARKASRQAKYLLTTDLFEKAIFDPAGPCSKRAGFFISSKVRSINPGLLFAGVSNLSIFALLIFFNKIQKQGNL